MHPTSLICSPRRILHLISACHSYDSIMGASVPQHRRISLVLRGILDSFNNHRRTICTCFGLIFLVIGTGGQSIPQGCLPDQVQTPVKQSFQKLTPTFSPNGFSIQFKTDARISLNPMNPFLVQFLQQYYSTAVNRMCQAKDTTPVVRSGMILSFKSSYEDFLSRIGLPMSCISYYAGAADKVGIENLQRLYENLSHKSGIGSVDPDKVFTSINGQDLAKSLGMYATQTSQLLLNDFTPQSALADSCGKVFWELKDGSVRANLPTMGPLSRKIRFPTSDKTYNANQGNMTQRIESYWSQSLSCLKNDEEKANFSFTISQWISTKLVPQLMKSPTCVKGFPRILQLMVSFENYQSSTRSRSFQYQKVRKPYVRQRDNAEGSPDYDTDDYFQPDQPLVAARQDDHDDYFLDPELLKYLDSLSTSTKTPRHGPATASAIVPLILLLIIFIVLMCVYCCLDPAMSGRCQSYFARVKAKLLARSRRDNSAYSEYDSLLKNEEMNPVMSPEHSKPYSKPRRPKRPKQKYQKIQVCGLPCRSDEEISIVVTSCNESCRSGELEFAEASEGQELNSSSSSSDSNPPGEPHAQSVRHPEYKKEYIFTRKDLPQDFRKEHRHESFGSSGETSSSWRDNTVSRRYDEQPWNSSDRLRDKYLNMIERAGIQKGLAMTKQLKSQFYDRMIANWKEMTSLPDLTNPKPHNNSIDEYVRNLGPPPPPRLHKHN